MDTILSQIKFNQDIQALINKFKDIGLNVDENNKNELIIIIKIIK